MTPLIIRVLLTIWGEFIIRVPWSSKVIIHLNVDTAMCEQDQIRQRVRLTDSAGHALPY